MITLAERAKRIQEIRFLRFAFIGACGFLVNELALYLTIFITGVNKYIAWFPAFAVAVTFTWWGNRTLTFRDRAASRGLLREWFAFLIGNSLGAAANFFVYFVMLRYAPQPFGNPLLALVAATLVGLVFNFTVSSRYIFRDPKE